MKLRLEPHYTLHAQNQMPDVDCVYADEEFIVERHSLPATSRQFEFRLVVKRRDGQPIGDWRTLQDAKNQAVGAERGAIQVFPPESEVTDTANLYHLWVWRPPYRCPLRIEPAAR
jgi:hypothetical protein